MDLGSGIDAATGKLMEPALLSDFAISPGSHTSNKETLFVKVLPNVSELHHLYPPLSIFQDSLTFPEDTALLGVNVRSDVVGPSLQNTAQSDGTPTSTLFLAVDWSRNERSTIATEPRVRDEALQVYARNADQFREKYGEYFVAVLALKTRYTIVWYRIPLSQLYRSLTP